MYPACVGADYELRHWGGLKISYLISINRSTGLIGNRRDTQAVR